MSNVDLSAPETPRLTCRVSARMTFVVSLAAELVVQVAASRSAGAADDEQLEVTAERNQGQVLHPSADLDRER